MSIKCSKSNLKRINIAYMIFIMFGLNMFLETSLTSFLVAPSPLLNVDSLKDILERGYEVVGRPFMKEYLDESNFTGVFTIATFKDCMKKVEAGQRVACVKDCQMSAYYKPQYDSIHVSKKPVKRLYHAFLIREDWPLRIRVNKIVQKMREGGILSYLKSAEFSKFEESSHVKVNNKTSLISEDLRPLDRKAMSFVWYVLITGIFFALGAFIVELRNNRN